MTILKKIILPIFLLSQIYCCAQDSVFYQNVEWSPDGKKICSEAILKKGNSISYSGFILNLKNNSIEKKIADATFPAWSHDGKWIGFSKVKNRLSDIWLVNLKSGDSLQLTETHSRNTGLSFSPDSKKICFSSDRNGRLNLYIMKINGSDLEQITFDTVKYFNPVWNPKKNEIVYFREKGDGRDKIYKLNLSGKKEIKITDDSLHNYYPGWFPDGKRIIYTTINPGDSGSYKQTAQIGYNEVNRKLIPNTKDRGFSRVSPKGEKIAFIQGNFPVNQIYISNIDGTNKKCITCSLKW